jgi:hypothetical protein
MGNVRSNGKPRKSGLRGSQVKAIWEILENIRRQTLP